MIGAGILKRMAVTLRNFAGSYFDKERLITVQYPEERSPLPENYRNFPFLIYDTEDAEAGLCCVACKICEKECPPQCIYIVKSEDKKPDYMRLLGLRSRLLEGAMGKPQEDRCSNCYFEGASRPPAGRGLAKPSSFSSCGVLSLLHNMMAAAAAAKNRLSEAQRFKIETVARARA
jgi:ferredoxin